MQLKHFIEWVVLFPYRVKAIRKKRKSARGRIAAIETYAWALRKLGENFRHSRRILNVSLFILLIDKDLSEIMTDLVCAIGAERRQFVAGQLAVLLFESSEDLTELLGREYRATLDLLSVPSEWIGELNQVSGLLNSFKNSNREFLGKIRNMIGAHRDKDALLQYEMMQSIDPLKVAILGPKFQEAVDRLCDIQINLMRHMDSPTNLAIDMSDSVKNAD